jgi:hypothetical protein
MPHDPVKDESKIAVHAGSKLHFSVILRFRYFTFTSEMKSLTPAWSVSDRQPADQDAVLDRNDTCFSHDVQNDIWVL